jgi:hypothetical protein
LSEPISNDQSFEQQFASVLGKQIGRSVDACGERGNTVGWGKINSALPEGQSGGSRVGSSSLMAFTPERRRKSRRP